MNLPIPTIQNSCFCYNKRRDDSISCIDFLNKNYQRFSGIDFDGESDGYYFVDGDQRCFNKEVPKDKLIVSDTHYLSLLKELKFPFLDIAICCETIEEFKDIISLNKISNLKPHMWDLHQKETCIIGNAIASITYATVNNIVIAYAETYLQKEDKWFDNWVPNYISPHQYVDAEKKKDTMTVEHFMQTIDKSWLLGVLIAIERNMPKDKRKRTLNIGIIMEYITYHTSFGGSGSAYQICDWLGVKSDGYTFIIK